MCGIFAWSGLKPGQFNKDKFNITGIWNETRGEHSCGIAVEGDIKIGINGLKVYRDFVAAEGEFPVPKTIPSIIGHTRHATYGSHTLENAHPFGFGTGEAGGFAFVGVHNGTLLNHEALAKKYDVSLYSGEGKKRRKKIDSEVLLEILYTTEDFKVLSEYNGAAALVFQYLDEPDVVYYYHGKSLPYDTSTVPTEERPLYFYKDTKNSLYVSSIEDSLVAIGGTEKTVGEFKHNTVYKVKNGDVANAEQYTITRRDRFQKESYYSGYSYSGYGKSTKTNSKKGKSVVSNLPAVKETNIYKEEPLVNLNQYHGRVYFNKLRYWRNGHKVEGIYTYVKGYGFKYLSHKLKDAEEAFFSTTNKLFFNGEFYNSNQLTKEQVKRSFIPFKHGGKFSEISNPPLYSFFDGIMMEHYLDYSASVQKKLSGKGFSIKELSTMSKHPIVDLTYSYRDEAIQGIYSGGKLYGGIICPLGSNRVYKIESGNLISTIDLKASLNQYNDVIKEASKDLDIVEAEIIEDSEEDVNTFVDNDLLEDDITKMFSHAYDNFPRYKTELEKYGNNARALQAIGIISTFLNSTYQLLTLEQKD